MPRGEKTFHPHEANAQAYKLVRLSLELWNSLVICLYPETVLRPMGTIHVHKVPLPAELQWLFHSLTLQLTPGNGIRAVLVRTSSAKGGGPWRCSSVFQKHNPTQFVALWQIMGENEQGGHKGGTPQQRHAGAMRTREEGAWHSLTPRAESEGPLHLRDRLWGQKGKGHLRKQVNLLQSLTNS